jgi:molybdate transport system substrate-binding protein
MALARSGIGIAAATGRIKPDVSSTSALRNALLNAKSLAYLRVGSGLYLDSLLERLDLREAVKTKTLRPVGDSVAILVARGRVELGLVVITQILTTPGVELVGPLPAEVQSYVTFVAAVSSEARSPDSARQLIRFLADAAQTPAIVSQGMERPPF